MLRNIFSCLGLSIAVLAIIAGFIFYIWKYNDTFGKMDIWTFIVITVISLIVIGIRSLLGKD